MCGIFLSSDSEIRCCAVFCCRALGGALLFAFALPVPVRSVIVEFLNIVSYTTEAEKAAIFFLPDVATRKPFSG